MSKKFQNQIKRYRQQGFTPTQILQNKAIANKAAKEMLVQAKTEAFVEMIEISAAVLAFKFWPKTAKAKIQEYIHGVINIYESLQTGEITKDDINGMIEKYAKTTIDDIMNQELEKRDANNNQ